MSNERYIFTKEELEAYKNWILKKRKHQRENGSVIHEQWIQDNPCPLPSPVIVPSDEEIMDFTNDLLGLQNIEALGFIKGFKHLRHLIFGF